MANKLKKGDKVRVLLGKDRGKEGAIERVFVKDGKVLIPGINVYKKHIKAGLTGGNEGGIIDIVKPINISNAGLICPSCGKVTRVGFEVTKTGKVRICRKCKKQI